MAKQKPEVTGDGAATPATNAEQKEVTTVKMDDGRTVDFPGKRRVQKESFIEGDTVKVRFDFINGETRTFTMPSGLTLRFAAHGIEQKLGDSYAGVKDIDDCIVAFDDLAERLASGEWAAPREASSMTGSSLLIKAMAEVYNKPVERIKEFLAKKTNDEKNALKNSDELKGVIARLESERLAKKPKVDTAAMLAEFAAESGDGAAPAES